MNKPITIDLGDKIVSLKFNDNDFDYDVDDLLKIDYSNVLGELLTIPVFLNKIGILKAQQESITSKAKMNLDIGDADLKKKHREKLTERVLVGKTEGKQIEKVVKPVQDEIDVAVKLDPEYRRLRAEYIKEQKNLEYINSFYWACKDKSDKLNKLAEKITPEEFNREIMETTVNKVKIKFHKKLYPDRA